MNQKKFFPCYPPFNFFAAYHILYEHKLQSPTLGINNSDVPKFRTVVTISNITQNKCSIRVFVAGTIKH